MNFDILLFLSLSPCCSVYHRLSLLFPSSTYSPLLIQRFLCAQRSVMSEKGGKGSSLLNKSGSFKGKDDSTTKSAKGRKVQFATEDLFGSGVGSTPKSGGKGEFSKGGKGDETANGRKSPVSKAPSDPRIDQALPENIKSLMDCEAADILQGIQEQMVMLSRDSSIKLPVSFDKALQYAKSNNKYSNPEAVRRTLEPLKSHGFSDNEVSVIANMCPETVDEVYALIPSIKEKGRDISQVLKDSLSELAKLKQLI